MTKNNLLKIFDELKILYNDLNQLIVQYTTVQYLSEPSEVLKLFGDARPTGLASDQQFLYLCDYTMKQERIRVYNLKGHRIIENKCPTLNMSSDLDLYQNCLYVLNRRMISIFDLQFQLISTISLPHEWGSNLKVDQNLIFITFLFSNQVYVYTKEGNLQCTCGATSASSKPGEFHYPRGLFFENNILYICDSQNNRIQELNKK